MGYGGRYEPPAPSGKDGGDVAGLDGLPHFEKNFYVEAPSVASMTDDEVEEYRRKREITVEGRDVPKPIRSFKDAGFPGKTLPLF